MSVLICAATSWELDPVAKKLNKIAKRSSIPHIHFLVHGTGNVDTTYRLTQFVCKFAISKMVQIGLAGTYTEKLPLSSLVQVKRDINYGFGSKNVQGNVVPFQKEDFVDIPMSIEINPSQLLVNLPVVNALTSQEVSLKYKDLDIAYKALKPSIETMEGFAFFFVAQKFSIQCLQIRAISNQVGNRDKSKWQSKQSIDKMSQYLYENIDQLFGLQ